MVDTLSPWLVVAHVCAHQAISAVVYDEYGEDGAHPVGDHEETATGEDWPPLVTATVHALAGRTRLPLCADGCAGATISRPGNTLTNAEVAAVLALEADRTGAAGHPCE